MTRDLRLAFRSLRSWRVGATVAVLTIAVGIGTATSMYALVRMALASTIPDIEDLPSLGRIYASSRSLGIERAPLTLKDLELLSSVGAFESVAAYASEESDIAIADQPAALSLGEVSEEFFSTMRAHAASGRLFAPRDFREAAPVAIVSDRIWRTRFAGRAMSDATIAIDGNPRQVIGVLPPGFGFSFIGISADVWIPTPPRADAADRRVVVLARLKAGATWSAAALELDALARPQNPNGLWTWTAITVEQDVQRRATGGFAMMFGPALIVLLIGCTNVACMLLARGIDRDVELGVRSALGATRGRVMRQLAAESIVLGALGGALGSALAYALLRTVDAAMAQFRPGAPTLVPSVATLLPTCLAFSAGACVLFGLLPTLRLSRRDIATSLKGGPRSATGRFTGYRARDLVVFVEVGAAVALVVTTALFVRFFMELQRITPQFPADQIVTVALPAPEARSAIDRIAGVPGVRAVTAASSMPGTSSGSDAASARTDLGQSGRVGVVGIQRSFFDTLGIPIVRGRSFDASEAGTTAAIVSEAAARLLWPTSEPIGARLSVATRTGTWTTTVVGVSGNVFDGGGLTRSGLIPPDIYVPLDAKAGSRVLLFARAAADPRLLVKPISLAARASPSAPLPRAERLEPQFVHDDSLFVIRLFAGFGLIALLLATTGIFGVISQSVAQRTTEFGVRMAMGATGGQVLRMIIVREGKLIAAAVATGVTGTVLVTRSAFVEMLVISGSDPRTWFVVAALCGGMAAIAVAMATWRIVRLDPWKVLRDA